MSAARAKGAAKRPPGGGRRRAPKSEEEKAAAAQAKAQAEQEAALARSFGNGVLIGVTYGEGGNAQVSGIRLVGDTRTTEVLGVLEDALVDYRKSRDG